MGSSFSARLEPGERLLWEGKPDKVRFVLGPENVFLIPFSLMWGGFAIFWETSAITSAAPVFFWLWGIPFVLAGLYLIFGRFLIAATRADRTYYAVTDHRVFVETGLLSRSVQELDLKRLPYLQLNEGRGGVGSILFTMPGPGTWSSTMSPGWAGYVDHGVAFRAIPDVAGVYRTIQHVRAQVDA